MAIFDAEDVVAGPIYDIEQIFADAQYQARNAIVNVIDPTLGEVRMPGVTPRFTVTPGAVRHPGMSLGASNDDVYLGELGLDRDDYKALCAEGVI